MTVLALLPDGKGFAACRAVPHFYFFGSLTATLSNGSTPVSTTVTVLASAGTEYLAQVLSVFLGATVIFNWFGDPCTAAMGLPSLSFMTGDLVLPSESSK